MPKRPSPNASGPIDIFNDDDIGRAAEALTAATAPVADAGAPPQTSEVQKTQPPASEPTAVAQPVSPEARSTREPASRDTSVSLTGRDAAEPARAKKPAEAPTDAPEQILERNVGLKLSVPQSLKSDFQSFRVELSAALGGVSIDDSNIGRPIVEQLLIEHRERILQAAKEHRGELRRPVNRDPVAMAEFDEALGAIFREALAPGRRRKSGRAEA